MSHIVVRWIVRRHGICRVLGWLEDYAGDIATWGVDWFGRNGDEL